MRCTHIDQMLLIFVILSTLMLTTGAQKDFANPLCRRSDTSRKCKHPKPKWFLTKDKVSCYPVLACFNGFEYRIECERSCTLPRKNPSARTENPVSLIVINIHTQLESQATKSYVTKSTTTTTKKVSQVTKPNIFKPFTTNDPGKLMKTRFK